MARIFSPDVVAQMCRHMNEDHSDAVAAYARFFGNFAQVEAARLAGFDAEGMEIQVDSGGERHTTRIDFDHSLQDADDARRTLILMAQQAAPAPAPEAAVDGLA